MNGGPLDLGAPAPAAAPPVYHRLPGRKRSLASIATLWWADDHLLVAEIRFWTEAYRRIYFRDIQAMVLVQDGRFLAISMMTLLLAVLLVVFCAATQGGWRVFWGLVLGTALVGGAIHFVRGATGVCEVTTPLGVVRLPVRRMRQARRTMAQIRALVLLAQGAEERTEVLARAVERGPEAPPPVPVSASPLPPPIVRAGRTRGHAALCAFLTLDAMVTVYQLPHGNTVINAVAAVIFLGCILAAILALVAASGTDLGRGFTWFAATSLGIQILIFVAGWFVMMAGFIQRAQTPGVQPDLAQRAFLESGLETIGPYEIALQSLLALWGLVLLLRWRRARASAWISLTT